MGQGGGLPEAFGAIQQIKFFKTSEGLNYRITYEGQQTVPYGVV